MNTQTGPPEAEYVASCPPEVKTGGDHSTFVHGKTGTFGTGARFSAA
jgi:hypothetical protein